MSSIPTGEMAVIDEKEIFITSASAKVKETLNLDVNITHIHGILLTSDRDEIMYYRGSVKLAINDTEILPEGYEAKLLMSGLNVSPNERFYAIDRSSGNNIVEIAYQDTAHPLAAFQPYRVKMYVYGYKKAPNNGK